MFKKYYKEANDDIETNRTLIDRIFEEAEKPLKKKIMPKAYGFGTAAAAVLVLAVSVGWFVSSDGSAEKKNTAPQLAVVEQQEKSPSAIKTTEEKTGAENASIPDTEGSAKRTPKPDETEKSSGTAKEEKPSAQKDDNIPTVPQNAAAVREEPTREQQNPTIAEPIVPETSSVPENSDNSPVLAIEAGEGQGFAIPDGTGERTVDGAVSENSGSASVEELAEVGTAEAAVIGNMLTACFGEADETTGNTYVFEIAGKTDEVYLGRWKWIVDNHSSLLTEFVITADMSAMYECSYNDDGEVQWSTENNLLLD